MYITCNLAGVAQPEKASAESAVRSGIPSAEPGIRDKVAKLRKSKLVFCSFLDGRWRVVLECSK